MPFYINLYICGISGFFMSCRALQDSWVSWEDTDAAGSRARDRFGREPGCLRRTSAWKHIFCYYYSVFKILQWLSIIYYRIKSKLSQHMRPRSVHPWCCHPQASPQGLATRNLFSCCDSECPAVMPASALDPPPQPLSPTPSVPREKLLLLTRTQVVLFSNFFIMYLKFCSTLLVVHFFSNCDCVCLFPTPFSSILRWDVATFYSSP